MWFILTWIFILIEAIVMKICLKGQFSGKNMYEPALCKQSAAK